MKMALSEQSQSVPSFPNFLPCDLHNVPWQLLILRRTPRPLLRLCGSLVPPEHDGAVESIKCLYEGQRSVSASICPICGNVNQVRNATAVIQGREPRLTEE